MSFILDALKKLEQNRKRGEVPDLTTVHLQDHEPPKKRATWPYLLLAALLLNAGIFTALLRPWGEEKDIITSQPDVKVTEEGEEKDIITSQPDVKVTEEGEEEDIITSPPDVKVTEEVVRTPPVKDKADDTAVMKAEDLTENTEAAVKTAVTDKKMKEVISETDAEPEALIEQEKSAEKSDEEVIASIGLDPTPEELAILRNKIIEERDITNQAPVEEVIDPLEPDIIEPEGKGSFIEFSQLPEDVKRELPEININAHIFSDNKAARIVTINGFVTREGDEISSGLIMDEITTIGVIFSYKEHRFRVRVF